MFPRSATLFLATAVFATAAPAAPKFRISFPPERSAAPLDGRLLLLLSTDFSDEPRKQINDTPKTQIVFGIDVDALSPGQGAVVDESAYGYPIRSLAQVPPGEYNVQAVLHRYETFHRSDGHTVKLPMDRGEGQQWNSAPGNLFSKPRKIRIAAASADDIAISLTEVIPPIPPLKDTKYIRHVRIQSQLLTRFWGRPMFLGAHILVPEGFDEHPQARYPVAIFHGHFPADFDGFRTTPPDPKLKPDYSDRFHIAGYNRIQQEEAYKFYQQWTAPNFPRFLVVEIQHANPYYDDSYAVNSANLGPYGDAIETELLPYIEKQFRAIGQSWARFTYGGSTGGWEALAVQVFYPDHYNGAFAACPDPVDFRAYTNINLYEDKDAFYLAGAHKEVEQPAMRDYLGHVTITQREANAYELALGSHGRSGEQYDIWQAVYSPVGADGYPQPIFDKQTGAINPAIAAYWRDHYDLSHILQRDWPKLGPKLQGKIHVYVGSADTYFLNDAVYYLEDFLKKTTNPPYGGEVQYGDRAEHCWNGDPALPNYLSRLHYNTMYVPKMLDRMTKTAPAGADLKSWRY
ncbi:MAG TPA: alpha/beta hydrolase-fold protein [Bryobacteraceae bacterium]|nr:alpha/beta hydrolase-fold protein [Bryobacteraceae bacterium]